MITRQTTTHLDIALGTGEERTESYKWYGEGEPEPKGSPSRENSRWGKVTPRDARSISRVVSSAGKQADVMRRLYVKG